MEEFDVRGQRLVALCLLGLVLFSYPVLGVFNIVFNAAMPPQRSPDWVLSARLYPLTKVCADALQSLAPKGSAVAEKVTPALKRSLNGSDDTPPESKRDKPAEGGYDPAAQKRLDDLVEKSL